MRHNPTLALLSALCVYGCAGLDGDGRVISGSIVDAASGSPVMGADVSLIHVKDRGAPLATTDASVRVFAHTTSNAEGMFTLRWNRGPRGGTLSVADTGKRRGRIVHDVRSGARLNIEL